MPVTLQPTAMKYKEHGGSFVSVDCIKGDPGSIDNAYATNIPMSSSDQTTIAEAIAAIRQLPAVTASDNGKVLRVVNGAWAAATIPSASGVSF